MKDLTTKQKLLLWIGGIVACYFLYIDATQYRWLRGEVPYETFAFIILILTGLLFITVK